jgi:hypothetical protein
LLVGDQFDGSLVNVTSTLIVLSVDLLESGVLQPDYEIVGQRSMDS